MTQLAADSSLFDALFRVRAPAGELERGLRALGVDPTQLAPRYTAQQWRDAVELYRVHLFPEELSPMAHRKLGYALAHAYAQTLSGRLLSLTLPMLDPLQLLRRWPRFVRMGRTDVTLHVTELSDRAVQIESMDPVGMPMELNFGLLEFCFERMGHRPTLRWEARPTGELVATCAW